MSMGRRRIKKETLFPPSTTSVHLVASNWIAILQRLSTTRICRSQQCSRQGPADEIVTFLQISSRSQQRERVHYLLETGYPVLPVMPTPLVQPAATEYPEEEVQYEDMEGTVYNSC